MEVYRLTRSRYAGDLSGMGAALYPGRWNLPGQRALYTSFSRSLAMLEVLVHLPRHLVPDDFLLQVIAVEEDRAIPRVLPESLPNYWREYPPPPALRQLGGRQLEQFPLLQVPSAIVPGEWNLLIVTASLSAGTIRCLREEAFPFDPRLFESESRDG
jgi:RES domain-containing protein